MVVEKRPRKYTRKVSQDPRGKPAAEQGSSHHPTRREVLKYGLYGGLGLAAAGAGYWCWPRRKEPNIILIVIDTLRADHVGCYGYQRNTTPNIDQLAKEGALFRKAISAAPWTLPSIASFLTSQYPCVLGIGDRPTMIDSRFLSLPEVLKQHDYTTHGIVSHVLVSARLGFGRGFDGYDEKSSLDRRGVTSPAVTQKAISFLQHKHKQSFFLFLHYFDPHYNYILHPQYNYYPSYYGILKSNHPIRDIWRRRHSLSKDDIKYLALLYDSEIAFTDQLIGALMDELKKRDLYDNSVIIITSDHGEEFMERGWIGHCTTLYQELIRVPLIIKFPDTGARTVNTPVGLIDIMPTLLAYLGLKSPDGLEGKALDIASGAPLASRPIFSETFNHLLTKYQVPDIQHAKRTEPIAFRAITLGDWKLIYDEKNDIKQIYDLYKDPYERNDLSSRKSKINKTLAVSLSQYIDYVGKKQKRGPTKDASELFTPEERRRLESLGYVE